MDADADAELDAAAVGEALVEGLETREDVEAGAHPPTRVVFVGLRIAEIDHEPVADILGDMPLEAAHRVGADLLISTQHLAQIFRV